MISALYKEKVDKILKDIASVYDACNAFTDFTAILVYESTEIEFIFLVPVKK